MKPIKEGDVIRHKITAKPLMVIVINPLCMFVIDLEENNELRTMKVLLKKDYCNWAKDLEMKCDKRHAVFNEAIIKWEFNPVYI